MSYLKHKPGSIEEIMANQNQKLNDNAYQDMFKKELEKAGRGIGAMSPKEKKDFFNKIDDKYKAKNEEVNEGITEPNGTISQKNKDLLKVNNYITVKGKVYVIDKVSLVSGVYTMKASDKNGKMHTISSKDVDSVEHWKNSLKVASYDPKNEELHPRDVPHLKKMVKDGASDEDIKKMHPRITDYELEKLKESVIDPKGIKEEDAYDNDRFIIKNGKATVDNSNTADKKDHVHAPDAKTALQLHKQGKKVYKETHTFVTNKQNQKQKDVDGEKKVVDPKPKMSFKEAYKKVKENQNTVDDSTQDRVNQGVSGEDNKKKDPDIKKPKAKADTGSKATPVDTSPEVEYKN